MKILKNLIILLYVFNINLSSYAHPHVFIDYKVTVIFSKNTLKQIKMIWYMDDITSTNFLEEFDLNKDQKLDIKEINNIKNITFNNLKKESYFTTIFIDDKKNKPNIKDFKVIYDDNLIKYFFTLDFNIKALNKSQKVVLNLNDKTNYVAFNPLEEKITYEKSSEIAFINIEPQSVEEQTISFKFSDKK